MGESDEKIVERGDYVVVQRQNYHKLYKATEHGTLMLGKLSLDMSGIIGNPVWTTYEVDQKGPGMRSHPLRKTNVVESLSEDLKSVLPSGLDNRTIVDDGTSQLLSTEQIASLREAGKSGKEIVGKLIENSKTFHNKTEYSQAKYLKKKEKKYFRYITIRKPTIPLLHDIFFRMDHQKISGLRMDTLAQLLSYSGVKADGLYMLYDSGSQGLPAAAMLHRIGANTNGKLLHIHPGNIPQKYLVQAMNFPEEQLNRMIFVNIHSLLRMYYQGIESILEEWKSGEKSKTSDLDVIDFSREHSDLKKNDTENSDEITVVDLEEDEELIDKQEVAANSEADKTSENKDLKRKLDDKINHGPPKKPKWLSFAEEAVDLIKKTKAEGLVIVAKEHPLNIIKSLLPFLGASRPFVIYHASREPLQETYVALKQRSDVINLRLFTNFLRSYQVLPDRTHPDILMSDTGGYLLYGYSVE
ncbi:tRNA (adenine(58)-N(1))-methyltransferase non-catalytic subunit TRM6 [Athalia rosae]|uniref:tRNA (adenine(58)-N(1))-methyltransferase non-catalytic subunit TRM6 n=1 Tax=Athalia rosae TaxID=37344 RepID=UPI0020344986|nr:tRNA (adenine(58)-N(1))-methyltransferase non-catalytic subunit TRM6 [Athalia rosae]